MELARAMMMEGEERQRLRKEIEREHKKSLERHKMKMERESVSASGTDIEAQPSKEPQPPEEIQRLRKEKKVIDMDMERERERFIKEFETARNTASLNGEQIIRKLKKQMRKLRKKQMRQSGKGIETETETEKETEAEADREHQALLIKDITSLEIQRKDLVSALTPTLSRWKDTTSQAHCWTSTTSSSKSKIEPTTSSGHDKEQLADHFDFILQDVEDLGHRMLSMLHSLKNPQPTSNLHKAVCSYKARELIFTTSKLHKAISDEFYMEDQGEEQRIQEEQQTGFLNLFSKYHQSPQRYENELTNLVTGEDLVKNRAPNKFIEDGKREEEELARIDKSSIEYLKKLMDIEHNHFSYVRNAWQNVWGSKKGSCGAFQDTTTLSPMHFTHLTPGVIPSSVAVTASTLQIYSIKIKILKDLKWPLRVYGEVAARDTVDRNRNILFSRSRFEYQELTREDCCLCLTGPSRAILAMDYVDFEVELETVEGAGRDRELINLRHRLEDGRTDGDGRTCLSLSNDSCVAEVTFQHLVRSLQATILGVRLTKGRWPFKCGCRVVCSWSPIAAATDVIDKTYRRVVLFDHCGRGMHRGSDKHLELSRQVISVESKGTLRVAIDAYGKFRRRIVRSGHVDFAVQQCQISTQECLVGDATVEVTVGWSLLVGEKADLLLDCSVI